MPENLKKLTDQIKADLSIRIADKSFSDVVAKTKAAGDSDSGTFKVIASTADVDRQGDSVDQNGWDLSFYKLNPIVLWAHDYSALPIGMCTSIYVEAGKLVAEGKFAPEDCNPFAQQVRRLYDGGFVKTTSVGFIPKEFKDADRSSISKAELLEFSFVPVPANPYALTMRQLKDLKIDTALMLTKGIALEVKEDAPAPEAPKPAEATPAPAPAEAVPPADKTAKKGEVTDELARIERNQQKGKKTNLVWNALDAFFSAYYDEATAVEDFGKMLSEFADICKTIAGDAGSKAAEEAIAKMSGGRASLRNIIQTLSNSAHREPANLPNGGSDKGQKPVVDEKELNDFLFARAVTKDIVNVLGKALEDVNKRVRERGTITKKPK